MDCFVLFSIFTSSFKNIVIHLASDPVDPKDIYSASTVDLATVGCFFEYQLIAPEFIIKQYPDVDFLSSISLAQSESVYPISFVGLLPLYIIQYSWVCFKYLSKCLMFEYDVEREKMFTEM